MVPKKAALLCLQHRHQLLTAAALCSKFAITGTLMCVALLLSPHLLARATAQTIPSISQILQDLDIVEDSCTELHKECHCGSIAQGPDSALFTRIVFPNTTTVIEEYDENVPYGYKHLRVYYRCADEENVLVGNNMRECSNGNWKGLVPRCARNLRNLTRLKTIKIRDYRYREDKKSVQNGTQLGNESFVEEPINAVTLHYEENLQQSPNGTFEIPLDSQPVKCISWGLFPRQMWSLTLSKPTQIHYVRIKLYGDKIEDLHQNRDIAFEMSLKNITYYDPQQVAKSQEEHIKMPIEIKCRETLPPTSQYTYSYKQKFSANYLILDFLCEVELIQKSIFEYFFSIDYKVDQLYASVIEVRFAMLNLKVSSQEQGRSRSMPAEEIELAQKIYATRMCALRIYSFTTDCGEPDIPVSAIVQREYNFLDDNERKTYKYICNDKTQELNGNPYVECGNYGRWKSEFPQCIRIQPCQLLTNLPISNDYVLDVEYESTQTTKGGLKVVPNGKYARFSCIKRDPVNGKGGTVVTVTPPANVKAQHMMYQGITQVICRNGKWIGLESANSNCISLPTVSTEAPESAPSNGTTSDDPSVQLVSLPVRLIRILFALFIILCLIIVSLLGYMFIFRHQFSHTNNGKDFRLDHFDVNSNLIPTIMYNDINTENNGGIIYSTESNVYERISLEDNHLYQSIKINNDNYSELSTYPINLQHEERENSIYGMEDLDIDMASTMDLDSLPRATSQLTVNSTVACYNQLSRSSSTFMKANSIYEN